MRPSGPATAGPAMRSISSACLDQTWALTSKDSSMPACSVPPITYTRDPNDATCGPVRAVGFDNNGVGFGGPTVDHRLLVGSYVKRPLVPPPSHTTYQSPFDAI